MPMRLGEELVGVLGVDYGDHARDQTSPEERMLIGAIARLGALVLERDRLLRRWAEAHASALALRATKEQMDIFLTIASHELKSPITVIKLSLQATERRLHALAMRQAAAGKGEGQAFEGFLEQLARTLQQVARMERLVNDLLDVSLVQAGKLELRPERADLATIVREVVETQRQGAPDRTIRLQYPPDLQVPVYADPGRLEQVVTNYLTNALKYSAEDCPIEVGTQVEQEQARVWVRDQGPGLPPEEQERIWERFHRAKGINVQSGSGVGLGMGLHICRTIMEQQGGQVGVESAPGQGSTFWFTLPKGDPAEGNRQAR
jgi:signal transduction histidine kinase